MVQLDPFELKGWPKKVTLSLLLRREGRSCLKSWSSQALSHGQRRTRKEDLVEKLELSGLESWTEENKERALDVLAEYHDIFTLEDGEMECTEATEHKIKVMDLKPFKERPRNIPSGLLEEVKDHLEHVLDVGAIKPSKLAWSNAVVLVQKKDEDLGFASILEG